MYITKLSLIVIKTTADLESLPREGYLEKVTVELWVPSVGTEGGGA